MSKRLSALAGMVTRGNVVCDVGCDHGFLAIYLVQKGISPRVLAMDVREGPLSRARAHVEERGLGGSVELRLSDGLEALKAGEAGTMVCAGMGGPLMMRILTRHPDRTQSLEEFILQPQSELTEFRRFLRQEGFRISGEALVREEGKYYFPMKAVREKEKPDVLSEPDAHAWELYDRFGKGLLEERHPLLREYLKEREEKLSAVCRALDGEGALRRMRRKQELERERELVKEALSFYAEG